MSGTIRGSYLRSAHMADHKRIFTTAGYVLPSECTSRCNSPKLSINIFVETRIKKLMNKITEIILAKRDNHIYVLFSEKKYIVRHFVF